MVTNIGAAAAAFGMYVTLGVAVNAGHAETPSVAPAKATSSDTSVDVVELAPSRKPFSLLTIENPWGDVVIEGYEGPSIIVESRKRHGAAIVGKVEVVSGADGRVAILTDVPGGVEASAVGPSGTLRPRIDLYVRMPRQVPVTANIKSGVLRARDLRRGASLQANAGTIEVERVAGAVWVDSAFAASTVRGVIGDVDIDVLRADVALDDIAGERLEAGVHEGRIAATRVRSRHVAFNVYRGDVVLDSQGQPRGTLRVVVSHGDIRVRLAPESSVTLRAMGGSIDLPGGGVLGKDSWHFGGAGGGTAVTLVSGSRGRVTFALP